MPTYTILKGKFGHLCVTKRLSKFTSERIYGEKPWAGGNEITKFRSRSDNAAIKRFKKYISTHKQVLTYYDAFGKLRTQI
jgi:hypothetical protein